MAYCSKERAYIESKKENGGIVQQIYSQLTEYCPIGHFSSITPIPKYIIYKLLKSKKKLTLDEMNNFFLNYNTILFITNDTPEIYNIDSYYSHKR